MSKIWNYINKPHYARYDKKEKERDYVWKIKDKYERYLDGEAAGVNPQIFVSLRTLTLASKNEATS